MLLFAGQDYYPDHPSSDFIGCIDTADKDTIKNLVPKYEDWYQVLLTTGVLVTEGRVDELYN